MEDITYEDTLQRYFIQALGIHLIVILSVWLFSELSLNFFDFDADKNMQKLQSSVRVDIVAMPVLTPEQLKALPTPPPVDMDKSKPTDVSTTSSFDSLMKEFEQKDLEQLKVKKKDKSKSKKGKESQSNKELEKLVLAGNKLAEGTETYGDAIEVDLDVLDKYSMEVRDKVHPFWQLPASLIDKPLQAVIQVFINKDGSLKGYQVKKSSGNSEFDSRAIKAVESAAPFRSPDKEIQKALEKGQVVLVFPF